MTPQQTQLLIPLLVVIPILALRWRRISKPRPLAWRYLWVRPLVFLVVAALLMASAPPLLGDMPWLALGLALGAAAGWQWGRAMAIEMHPENGTLMVKGSNIAMLVLVALVLVRMALKTGLSMEASSWHLDVALITDASICFSVGMFTLRSVEMYLRARKVMQTAPPPTAPLAAKPRRWPWIVGAVVALVVLLVGAAGTYVWVQTGMRVHAFVCPSCAGFSRAGEGVYVENDADAGQRAAAIAAIAEGEVRLHAFFGKPQSHRRYYVCISEACYARFKLGTSLGSQFLLNGIALSPRGINGTIAAHEATHVETASRVGTLNYYNNSKLPEWFKEGLAVVVAKDARYLPPAVPQDCDAKPDDLPRTNRYWGPAAAKDHMLYADAACLVAAELKRNGGTPALLTAFDRVKRGDNFSQLWKQ